MKILQIKDETAANWIQIWVLIEFGAKFKFKISSILVRCKFGRNLWPEQSERKKIRRRYLVLIFLFEIRRYETISYARDWVSKSRLASALSGKPCELTSRPPLNSMIVEMGWKFACSNCVCFHRRNVKIWNAIWYVASIIWDATQSDEFVSFHRRLFQFVLFCLDANSDKSAS